MTQPSLFVDDVCTRNHHNNPESRAAFEAIEPHLGRLQILVLSFIATRDAGATVKNVRECLKMEHQTASARLTELSQAGHIDRTGVRRDRCAVWKITPQGAKALKAEAAKSTPAKSAQAA